MTRTATIAALALAALLVPGRAALAQDHDYTRASLKGLPGIYVRVEDFTEENKRAGFDEITFQMDVELKLRLAGVKVLSKEQRVATPGMPWLYVNVSTLHENPGSNAAYHVQVAVIQQVRLGRDPEQLLPAPTWSTGRTGYGDLPYIRDHVKDAMDEFINAWLSVNPKK